MKIQDTLKAYAMARPRIKLALKIYGESAFAWSYSPCQGRTAIGQVLGSKWAENSYSFNSEALVIAKNCKRDPILTGYLPKPEATQKDIKDRAIFISVDGRPMSRSWHMSKKFVNIIKKQGCGSPPFLQVDLQLPLGSYDANVTPLKDEVMIHDEIGLIKLFEDICQQIYNENNINSDDKRSNSMASRAKQKLLGLDRRNEAAKYSTAQILSFTDESGGLCDKEERKVKSQMQITFSVNMKLNEDDSCAEQDTVEVKVQPRTPQRSEQPPLDEAAKRGPQSILKYFKPASEAGVEIYADETAIDMAPALANTENSAHTPLQPLTESALNALPSDVLALNSAESETGNNSPVLTVQYLPVASPIGVSPTRPPVDRHRIRGVLGVPVTFGPRNIYEQRDDTFNTHGNEFSLPTPPTSDQRLPRVRYEARIQRGELPNSVSLAAVRSMIPNEHYNGQIQITETPRTVRLRQSDEDTRIGNIKSRRGSPSGINDLNAEDGLFPPHRIFGDDHLSPSPQRSMQRRGASHLLSSLPPSATRAPVQCIPPPLPKFKLPAINSIANSSAWQKSLLSSQPSVARDETQSMGAENGSITPWETLSLLETSQVQPSSLRSKSETEDSRAFFIQRQRSLAMHGPQRRFSSRPLPLESIAPGKEVYNLCTEASLKVSDVRRNMAAESDSEHYAPRECQSFTLPLEAELDIERAEERLRMTVVQWMDRQPSSYDVVYRQLSQPKGN